MNSEIYEWHAHELRIHPSRWQCTPNERSPRVVGRGAAVMTRGVGQACNPEMMQRQVCRHRNSQLVRLLYRGLPGRRLG